MAKMVIYNGGTDSYHACSDPKVLEIGKVYEVLYINESAFQTYYKLKGVPGTYNSVWFDDVKTAYLSISGSIPVLGDYLTNFWRLNPVTTKFEKIRSSSVICGIRFIGLNTYEVETQNSIYVVQVY